MKHLFRGVVALLLALSVVAQDDDFDDFDLEDDDDGDGYIGYNLERRGDAASANYATTHQFTGVHMLSEVPDVYLNASVSVGVISVIVDNITAKVNLDAKVLNLLHFSAGVDASIDRVRLLIENISAEVELEARLENVVEMVSDVLHSIDLNPIIATLGKDINKIVNNLTGTLGQEVDDKGNPIQKGGGGNQRRSLDLDYKMDHNILYSINDYSGQTHTNRILAQNGSMMDVFLDNDGDEQSRKVVGYYSRDMDFNGHNRTVVVDGVVKEFELQYVYAPYAGLEVVCNVYLNPEGKVVRTRVIAEAEAGGSSTISDDDDETEL